MRFLKTFCTMAMISTCLSTSSNAAAMVIADLETAKQHARQHFWGNPVNALKGHSPITGNDVHDTALVQNPETINDEKINALRNEFNNIRRNQIIFELVDSYGIDPSLTHLPVCSEEYDRIDSETAAARIIEIATQTCDPAFAVIAEIRTALANELVQNILILAKKGNTVAAQYIWQHTQVPAQWLNSLFEQDSQTQNIIQELSDTGDSTSQYILARSLYIATGIDSATKMSYLAGMGTTTEAQLGIDAATDYWGVLRYIDLISRNDTNQTATQDWLDLFTKTAKLSLSQHVLTRPLHNKNGKALPRGYIDALRQFSGIPTEPIHLVLRKVVENTQSQGLAECYIAKYMYDFPDTKSLSFEDKLAEIRAICDIVPKAKGMLANIIMASTPNSSLGYSEKTPDERREALVGLVNSGDPTATTLLAKASAGGIAHHPFEAMQRHLGYKELTDIDTSLRTAEDYGEITQGRIANILHSGLRGSNSAQDLILKAPVMNEVDVLQAKMSVVGLALANGDSDIADPIIEHKSILQFYIEMNKTLGLIPAEADISVLTREASNLLMKQFSEAQILAQAKDFTGVPINFLSEVEVELAKTANA